MGLASIAMRFGTKFISKGASKLGFKSIAQKVSIFEKNKLANEMFDYVFNSTPRYVDDEILDVTKLLLKTKK